MATTKAQLGIGQALFSMLNGDDTVTREVFARAAKEAAEYWHKNLLEKHFQASAFKRYPGAYVARTKGYQIQKARKKHHQRPMVWKGDFLASQKAGYSLQPRIGKRLVRVTIRLPQARILNIWKSGAKHDFRESIEAMNAEDFNELRNVMAQVVGDHLAERVERDGAMVVSTHSA